MVALQQVVHSSSVDIRPEWAVVEQIPFTSLSKLNYQVNIPPVWRYSNASQILLMKCSR